MLQGRSDLGQRIVDSAVAQVPVIGDEIARSLSQSRLRGSGLALAVGVGLALWGGLGVAEAAQAAMNGIWNVPRRRTRTSSCAACAGWPGWSSSGVGCWALLQWLGGWYVARQLGRASATYGTFALVIGLLSWLYLASTVTLLAAELNVVRTRRLWPRSLAPPPLGRPDERALEGLARQEERLPDQRVEVSFGVDEADAGTAGERPAERGPPAQTR